MIRIKDVSKRYGRHTAIDHITAEISEEKIYCLLGCNGAGKTTLMKMIGGHTNADGGSIEVDGRPVHTAACSDSVSFIENRAVQFNTALKKLVQMAKSLDPGFDKEFAENMIQKFHLDKEKKFCQLSFGMQTMFNTILSLASSRKIILLDEPLSGLDAVMRNKFYMILNDSFERNPRTIIISTHLIDEMIKCGEELIIMDKGNIIFRSTINEIDEKAFSITGREEAVEPAIKNRNVIAKRTVDRYTTAYIFDDADTIPQDFSIQHMGLQDFFINMVGGDFDEE